MLPREPEALGLLALMLYAEARRKARRSADGAYIALAEQDVSLWDCERIAEAEAALLNASGMGVIARFQLEAAIQSAHVARRRDGVDNWNAVVNLYDALLTLTGSPVAAINRAVAVAETEGPSQGLAALDAVSSRSARARISALLGRACRPAGPHRRSLRSPRCLRDRHRPRARCFGAAGSRKAACGVSGLSRPREINPLFAPSCSTLLPATSHPDAPLPTSGRRSRRTEPCGLCLHRRD